MAASPFGITEPTEAFALAALGRVLGDAEATNVWERACEELGLPAPRAPLSRMQLRSIADMLAAEAGFVGVMGASLRLRIETYEAMSPPQGGLAG